MTRTFTRRRPYLNFYRNMSRWVGSSRYTVISIIYRIFIANHGTRKLDHTTGYSRQPK